MTTVSTNRLLRLRLEDNESRFEVCLFLSLSILLDSELPILVGPVDSLPKQGTLRVRTVGVPTSRRDTGEELESMYAALQGGLTRIHFFKGARQPEAVLRTLRTVLGRADMDVREARLVQAIGFEIGHYLDRLKSQA